MNNDKHKILKQIIEISQNQNFDSEKMELLKKEIFELDDDDYKVLLAKLYNDWSKKIFYKIISNDIPHEEFKKVFELIQEATLINPTNDKHFYNWGVFLAEYHTNKTGKEKEQLTLEEIEKYKIAAKLNSSYSSTFYNWGKCLFDLGMTKSSETAINYLKDAATQFERAISTDVHHSKTLNNLGSTYHSLGDLDIKNRIEWYEQALSCFSLATTFFPDKNSFDNLGIILKDLALTKKEEERSELFSKAIHNHLTAIQEGAEIYNLACTYAVMGDSKNALIFLERSLQTDNISEEEIIADPDWRNYLDNNQFKRILHKVYNIK